MQTNGAVKATNKIIKSNLTEMTELIKTETYTMGM